jgi:TPR repeat protein
MLATSEFQNLVRRAEDGDLEAQCSLAERYHHGDDVLRNYVEAEKWYLRSAEQGRPRAQCNLGLLYLKSLGNRAEGMRLLELAGKQGDEHACYELAKALSQPSDQGSDPVAAYIWFCLAEAYGAKEYGYGKTCEKEIQKLESELSIEQILSAQLRAREELEFCFLDVLAAREEAEARRAAEDAEARRLAGEAECRRLKELFMRQPDMRQRDSTSRPISKAEQRALEDALKERSTSG